MPSEIRHHRRMIFAVFFSFFIFVLFIVGIILIFFLTIFGHDFKEPKCFAAIDKWYKENNIKIDYEKRWQQHLECEKNMGFFPWGKQATFSK